MWTRKELKEKAKKAFKLNYWKCVLVALLIAAIAGGSSGSFSGGTSGAFSGYNTNTNSGSSVVDDNGLIGEVETDEYDPKDDLGDNPTDEDIEKAEQSINVELPQMDKEEKAALIVVAIIVGSVVVLLAVAIGLAVSAFLVNPLVLGGNRFFLKNLQEPAGLSNLMYAFDHGYMNIVKTMFVRDIYIFLWSLLCIIPGIVKGYEYRMIPYLLADHPEMTKDEVFAASKEMMMGQKWNAFVLDLSFIGWQILSVLTCGILSIFYVNPYIYSTNAALYEALKIEKDDAVVVE